MPPTIPETRAECTFVTSGAPDAALPSGFRSNAWEQLTAGVICAGLIYATCIGHAVKWFKRWRGLAAGLTAAGFGAGEALTVIPLTRSLTVRGYKTTFFYFALLQSLVVFLAELLLQKPAR